MRREITEKIEIPAGMDVEIKEHEIIFKKDGKEVRRTYQGFEIKKEENVLVLADKSATKKEKKLIKTLKAHVTNIINGFGKKYEYLLQICSVHFPMNVSFDKAKKQVIIKNYLGEVKPRIANVKGDVEVKIEKELITVTGQNREDAGQTAANIEAATRITNRDRRVFQDGIFITKKPGSKT